MNNVIDFAARRAQRDQEHYESDAAFDNMMGNLDELLRDMEADLEAQRVQERAHDRESFRILKANGYTDIEAQRVVKRERDLKEKFLRDVNRKVNQQMHEKYPDDPAYFPENWENC